MERIIKKIKIGWGSFKTDILAWEVNFFASTSKRILCSAILLLLACVCIAIGIPSFKVGTFPGGVPAFLISMWLLVFTPFMIVAFILTKFIRTAKIKAAIRRFYTTIWLVVGVAAAFYLVYSLSGQG